MHQNNVFMKSIIGNFEKPSIQSEQRKPVTSPRHLKTFNLESSRIVNPSEDWLTVEKVNYNLQDPIQKSSETKPSIGLDLSRV